MTERVPALVIAATLVATHGRAAAQPAGFALPREAEATIHTMLSEAALPEGCQWSGAQLDRDRVRTRYRCDGDALELVLVHRAVAPSDAARTAHFALLVNPGAPAELTEAVLAAVRAHERGDLWHYVGPPPSTREAARPIRPTTWGALALAIALSLLGAALARRRGDATSDPREGERWPLLLTLGASGLGSLLVMLVTFRFAMDDFIYLNTAVANPWSFDTELRVLGVRVPFFFGARLSEATSSGVAPFVALNVAAYLGVLAGIAAVSRRLGAHRHEAWLAALVVGLHPGFFELIRYASGFQQLLALALVLAALLAFDHGATRRDARGRVGWGLVALAAALAAALTKYPTAGIIPLAGLVFVTRSAPDAKAAAWRSLPVVAVGALLLMLHHGAEVLSSSGRVGVARLGPNAAAMARGVLPLLLSCALVASLGLLIRVRTADRGERRRELARWFERCISQPSERLPFALLIAVSAALFATPFLFNQRYFKDYYALFPALFVGLLGARAITRSWPSGRGRWSWALALIAGLALFPFGAIEAATRRTPRNQIGPWLAEASDALAQAPPARSIRIGVDCRRPEDATESERLLAEYHLLTERGHGLRWAAGLDRGVEITIESEAELTLYYCESERPRFWLTRRSPPAAP